MKFHNFFKFYLAKKESAQTWHASSEFVKKPCDPRGAHVSRGFDNVDNQNHDYSREPFLAKVSTTGWVLLAGV